MNTMMNTLKIFNPLTSKAIFKQANVKRFNKSYRFLSKVTTSDGVVVKSPAPDVELPEGNFIQFLLRDSHKWQNLTAVECAVSGYKITYAQLVDQSRRWSGFLKSIGIGQGDVVSVISPNSPHYGPLFLGTAAIGAVLSPINFRFNAEEISRMLSLNQAKVLIMTKDLERTVENALKDVKLPVRQFCIGQSQQGLPDVCDILTGAAIPFADSVDIPGNEVLVLPFSSGTTGFPKATALSHNSFIANLMQFMNPYHDILLHNSADGPQDVFLATLPFFHVYGLFLIFCIGIANGFKIVTVPQFDPTTFTQTIIKQKVSYLHTVPTMLSFMLTQKDLNAKDMSFIHTIFCGAAPVLPSLAAQINERLENGAAILEGYGMTETMINMCNHRHGNRLGTAGQLFSNTDAKIIDTETGKPLSVNQPGEIWLRTPSKLLHYLGDPIATSEMLTDDGWVRTGDIGFYDNEGYFSIVDRTKDLIKVKGFQVSPSEVEEVLQSHPAVMACCVVGVANERLGEAPKAYVVLKGKVSEKELKELVKSKLSKHKHLVGGVTFVDSLPKTETGKLLRRELRKLG